MAFAQFGPDAAFLVFYVAVWIAAMALLSFAKWLTAAGFTPIWGALTFPAATFTNINLVAMGKGLGLIATLGSIIGGVIATALIFYITYRALKMWAGQKLSQKTGAAVA